MLFRSVSQSRYKPIEEWMEVRAPGGLMLSFPTDYYIGVHLDFLDGGRLDAVSDA